jgi:hypothetical protein
MILRLCVLFAVLVAASPLWAQSTDKGLPAPGSIITLKPTLAGYEAGIVIARDAKYTDASISTTDAALAKLLQPAHVDKEPLPAAVAAPDQPADQAKPATPPKSYVKYVTVAVKPAAIPQGNYPLTLTVTGDDGAQVRDLILVVPAAAIDAPDSLIVVNEHGNPFGGLTANQPQIWETTQHAWLTHLSLDQKGNTDANGEPAGRIVPKGTLDDIKPGSNALIELNKQYSLDGAFPLGTTKGKLVLQADQLAQPVTFGFEVHSRIWALWMFPVMAFGLGLGYLTRTTLSDRLQLNQERENTYALMALIDRALARNADGTFKAVARAIRGDAATAAQQPTADGVKKDTTDLQNRFQAALDALNRRRGELDRNIASLQAIVGGSYGLPAALSTAVRNTKDALAAGLPELTNNDVGAAADSLRDKRVALCRAAVDAGTLWLKQVAGVEAGIDLLKPFEPSAAADLKGHWTTARAATGTAVENLQNDVNSGESNLQAALLALHVGANALRNVTANVAAMIKSVVAGWTRILSAASLRQLAEWQAWQGRANDFAGAVDTSSPTDPSDAVTQFRDKAAALVDGLRAVLMNQMGDEAGRNEIGGLLDHGNYNEAISAVAAANPRAAPFTAKVTLGGTAVAMPSFTVVQFAPTAANLPSGTIGFASPTRQELTPVDVLAASAQRAVQETNCLLSWIYAALIAGAGYFLFADKWIGTPLDFALVFFWAYATDIGAEAATAAVKGVKRPS